MSAPRPTPEVIKELCKNIRRGNYPAVAAGRCGISRSVFWDWLKRGARGEEPYATLKKAVDKAEDACEASLVRTVKVASRDDYRAATWMLASKYPDRWHRESKAAEERAVKRVTARIITLLAKELPEEHFGRALTAIAGIDDCTSEACADAISAGARLERDPGAGEREATVESPPEAG